MHPMTGRVISGRYSLSEPIGRGAMGVVWRARDELLDRDVAVKEVLISDAVGEEERDTAYQRTLREARTAARLSHRGVVTIYDVVEEDGRPWIVMELVNASSLDQVIESEGPLTPQRAGLMARQLLAALASAHSAGVLHRDVKPSNVLLTKDDRAVLTDFGIATFQGDPRLTQTGMVMGSPGFTAPERIRGGSATPASDLWSLGATLYAAVEGRGPYELRGGAITTMSAIINEDAPVAPSAGALGGVIGALLRRNPDARPDANTAILMITNVLPTLPDDRVTIAAEDTGTAAAVTGEDPWVPLPEGPAGPRFTADPQYAGTASASLDQGAATSAQPTSEQPGYYPPLASSPQPGARARSGRWKLGLAGLAVACAAGIGAFLALPGGGSHASGGDGAQLSAATGPSLAAINQPGGAPADYTTLSLPPADTGTPAGFSISYPVSWRPNRFNLRVTYLFPRDKLRYMDIDLTRHTYPNMVAEARYVEANALADDEFPQYHQVQLAPASIRGSSGAVWEFTWVNATGVPMHGEDMLFNAGTAAGPQSYALFMVAPQSQWDATLPTFGRELSSFRPLT